MFERIDVPEEEMPKFRRPMFTEVSFMPKSERIYEKSIFDVH